MFAFVIFFGNSPCLPAQLQLKKRLLQLVETTLHFLIQVIPGLSLGTRPFLPRTGRSDMNVPGISRQFRLPPQKNQTKREDRGETGGNRPFQAVESRWQGRGNSGRRSAPRLSSRIDRRVL